MRSRGNMNDKNEGNKYLIILGVLLLLVNLACFKINNPERAGFGNSINGLVSHNNIIGGVGHAANYCKPLEACANCHGSDLKGGLNGEPSCYQCHGAKWEACSSGVQHNIQIGGINHAEGYCNPVLNCARCHGQDLKGGANNEPSCYKCHGELWKDCGSNAEHNVNLGGVFHADNYCLPYQNCIQCHGANLRGGINGEPSCLKCHSQKKWENCGNIQHNKGKEGVLHAMDLCNPFRDCVQCHGSNLQGGPNGEKSCYACHGDNWSKCKDEENGDDD